ncbi:hypothetical protein DJ64_31695 [Streptomyces griseorubens]|uniref:Uncharacterized protein n=1 Tax=Streptomyces griseorubens TaxID=66897 RepID=A0ABR4T9E3_9ACTN|nr:hypothetical protein DJ64_31695 [Streptomyces griseorubens]
MSAAAHVGTVELDEAFAVQSLARVDARGLRPGDRRQARRRRGVAAIRTGVGQALAVILENVTDEVSPG